MKNIFLSAIAMTFSLLAATTVLPTAAWSAPSEITIQDTSGAVRNVTSVDEAGHIEFSVTDINNQPATGSEITLTNQATGETLSAVAVNGTVAFESVPPGVWTVASVSPNITFVSVSVSSAALAPLGGVAGLGTAGTVGAVVLGGGILAGATVAIVDAQDNDNDDDDIPLSPSR